MSGQPFSQMVESTNADGQARLVIFYSDTCAPCKILKPQLRDWCRDWGLPLFEANAKDNMDAVRELGLRSLPSVVLLREGRAQVAFTGNLGRDAVRGCLEGHGVSLA